MLGSSSATADLVCIATASANLKWYENLAPR